VHSYVIDPAVVIQVLWQKKSVSMGCVCPNTMPGQDGRNVSSAAHRRGTHDLADTDGVLEHRQRPPAERETYGRDRLSWAQPAGGLRRARRSVAGFWSKVCDAFDPRPTAPTGCAEVPGVEPQRIEQCRRKGGAKQSA
jgi:hypothetical protein